VAETTIRLKTTGMHCGSCAMMVAMTLEDVHGVLRATSDYPTSMTEVTFDADVVAPDALVAAIEAAGYGAQAE
jgi:copper chaperone CopZ